MIVNRFDFHKSNEITYGVGHQILETSEFDVTEVDLVISLLNSRRNNFGSNVVAIDCGANIGVHTIEWAKAMHGWGKVIAFEAQERIFYALAGNIALNNCLNATAIYAAVGGTNGYISVPEPNYLSPGSFGSLEIRQSESNEFIGQKIDYSVDYCKETRLMAIDSLLLERLDFLKIDIEGMEIEALTGAYLTIEKNKPQMLIEKIKSNENLIIDFLNKIDYKFYSWGNNLIAVHFSYPANYLLSNKSS
jgi:FkbM family methyltransferase